MYAYKNVSKSEQFGKLIFFTARMKWVLNIVYNAAFLPLADQLPGFPALDQSKVSRTQLPIHRRSDIKSPLSPGGALMPPVEEEEEEEEVPDGGVVLSIPVPNINKPKPKRLTELTSGECTPGHNPSLSRSRASSISSISNAAVRPSIIEPIVDNTDREEERRRGRGGGRGRRIGESVRQYLRKKLPSKSLLVLCVPGWGGGLKFKKISSIVIMCSI